MLHVVRPEASRARAENSIEQAQDEDPAMNSDNWNAMMS
ncbi:hypothetical protein PAMC26577_17875 [Caballeronia sordidicola]|uniref:Uncharacterized protein n=1 Tax=Caballeronia sordidicola TaxID=196367 RepID=A0A242MRB8_CABSO|nr:hypothetical protein PAMC26577_17875 [Caballeronia sordidicola]